MWRLSTSIAGAQALRSVAMALRHSSTSVKKVSDLEDPRQRRYVEALRSVILASPPSGSKVQEIASGLETILGQDVDPSKFGFAKLSHALAYLQDDYYIINRDTLVRCEWSSILRKVRVALPLEGVLLASFVRHIAHVSPGFEDHSIPGFTLEQWVTLKWGHLFTVIPHPTRRAYTIFRRLEVERSKKVRQIERALTLLGRDPLLPVFTNVEHLVPLLPHRGNIQSWPTQMLTKGDIVEAFDIDVDMLIRLPSPPRFSVFVDGSTVSPIEVRRAVAMCEDSALLAAFDNSAASSSVDAGSSGATEDDPEYQQATLRYRHNVVHSTSTDVVVDSFMRIGDEIVAAIASVASKGDITFVVVISDAAASSVAELLRDSLPQHVTRCVVICTPSRRLSVSSVA